MWMSALECLVSGEKGVLLGCSLPDLFEKSILG